MSMTDALRQPTSTFRRFLDYEFPDLESACRETLAPLPARPLAHPERHNRGPAPTRTTGTAIDHRLRLAFAPQCAPSQTDQAFLSTIALGVQAAAERADREGIQPYPDEDRSYQQLARLGEDLLARFATVLTRTQPHSIDRSLVLDHGEEQLLCRLCYAGAWFDGFLRNTDVNAHPVLRLLAASEDASLDDLLGAVPQEAIDDMETLLRVADASELATLRNHTESTTVVAAPMFAGSADIGGADADLLVGELLLDIKTTRRPADYVREDLRQLLGYLLLDYRDQHAITKLAVYYARHGCLVTWDVDELLAAAGAQRLLKELRAECRRVLAP